jgi:hypothetical protein
MLFGSVGEHRPASLKRWQVRALGAIGWLAAALAAAMLSACDGRPNSSSSAADEQSAGEPYTDLTTPENAARSTLLCLVAERRAIARHDKPAAQRCRQDLQALAAKEEIIRRLRGQPHVSDLSDEEVLDQFTRTWGAIIGYYVEGLELDRMRSTPSAGTAPEVFVLVPARGASDAALIRLKCVRGEDKLWRVAAVGFQAEGAASQPASAPAP